MVQVLTLVVVTGLVFAPTQTLPVTFLPLPVLVWAALRFDVRTVVWQLAGLSVVTTYLTAHGYGPFGTNLAIGRIDAMAAGMLTQGYLLCAGLMSLPLAIAAEQRGRLIDRIRASERLFRRNFTESLVGMLLLRREGARLEIVDLNDTAARLVGSEQADLVGSSLGDLLDTPERLDLVAERMLAGNLEGWKAQTGLRDREGARVNVALSLLARDPHPMFAAQLLDVTAEYDARRRLEQAEKLTSATLDTTVCIILVTDLDGTIVRVNSATTGLTGYAEDELLGRPVWETSIAPSTAADVEATAPAPDRPGAPVMHEADAITRNGEKLRIVWNSSIVRDEQRPTDVRRDDRHRRHDRAHGVRHDGPPARGRHHHRADRHRHRRPDHGVQRRRPEPARLPVPARCSVSRSSGSSSPTSSRPGPGPATTRRVRCPDRHDRARRRGADAGLDLGVEGRHGGTRSR